MPFGILIQATDKLSFRGQHNFVVKGIQTTYTSRDAEGYPDAHNKQDKGWGMDFTANYLVDENLSIYGFFRYWSIDLSDYDSGDVTGFGFVQYSEPDNVTRKIGVGIAYRF